MCTEQDIVSSTVYYCALLRTTVHYCVLLCTTVYYCVLLCTTVYYCALLHATVYCCVLLCTTVRYCVLLWATAYCCVLLCTILNACGLQALAWSQGGNGLRQSSRTCRARSSYCIPVSTIAILPIALMGGTCCIRISCHSFIEIGKFWGGRAAAQPSGTSREWWRVVFNA